MEGEAAIASNEAKDSKAILGFWLYLMTDCVLFAALFATYAVLHSNTYGGPGGSELFNLPYALNETLVLLTSSFSCGVATIAVQKGLKKQAVTFYLITFALGAAFLSLELSEFSKLAASGNSWRRSGFLSSYFTLVGTHGLHITVGLIWISSLLIRLYKLKTFTPKLTRQFTLFAFFWHFLDVIWIFIFTIVYMFGGIGL